MINIPQLGENLNDEQLRFLDIFARNCRRSIIQMTANAQSGHPGGSLSCIDYLSLIYSFIISQTGEKTVISNGHISPAIYSVLAELDYIPRDEVLASFRKSNSIYEGHVSREVKGISYSTGPLGIGVSVASAFALSSKMKKENKKVFALLGDGETEEGQVYEMMNFASKYKLNNLIVFLDRNGVQLSDCTQNIMPEDMNSIFRGGGWNVIECDGHNYQDLWNALNLAYQEKEKPILISAKTIMGKGVSFMEEEGRQYKSTWHGNAPSVEQEQQALNELQLFQDDINILNEFKGNIKWHPKDPEFKEDLLLNNINVGKPIIYYSDQLYDCRTAYGKALVDLAKLNSEVIALTADLKTSVRTEYLAEEFPERHIECGIAEQHMVSAAGGFSLDGYIPFVSTFAAFMTSRAKDQARVNDINRTNVKMVATHAGLSVGEDGPTHQAIDDMGSMLGLLNTMIIEPADANQCDRILRYIASHNGNFYMRMGRHKLPVILKVDETIFYDEKYKYEYGKTDILREGKDLTLVAIGSMVSEALKATEELKDKISIELIAVTSIKKFDENLFASLKKTGKLVTVEDHNTLSGLGSQIAREIAVRKIQMKTFEMMGVENYQHSGKVEELYKSAGIDAQAIIEKCKNLHIKEK